MRGLSQDFRYAMRMLIKNPGFTALAVILLAVGIGVNTTEFSILDCKIFRPWPIEEPQQMVRISAEKQDSDPLFSYPDYEEIRRRSRSYTDILSVSRRGASLQWDGEITNLPADIVSANCFAVLGIKPVIGRTFTKDSEWNPGDPPEAIISYGLWQRRFASDPGIVGRTILVNRRNAVVRGIASPSFGGLMQKGRLFTEMWLPANQWPSYVKLRNREDRRFDFLLGRLQPDIQVETARAELRNITRSLVIAYPDSYKGISYDAALLEKNPLESILDGPIVLGNFLFAIGGPLLILIICCANVAGIGLARAEKRQDEIAVRLALGVGRQRLVRQLLVENTLLAIPGAGLGLLLTYWFIRLQASFTPPSQFAGSFDYRVDVRVLCFTLAVSLAAVLLSGLTPALQAVKAGMAALLKGATGRISRKNHKLGLRSVFVGGQVALSMTLFIAGGLFLKSMILSERIYPGFDSRKNILIVGSASSFGVEKNNQKFLLPAIRRIKNLPGVKGATYALRMPLSGAGGGISSEIFIPGIENPPGQKGFIIKYNSVGRDYFQTVGAILKKGRAFAVEDEFPDRCTAIINSTMAERFWPDSDPVDRTITARGRTYRIVGVAEDGRINRIHESPEPYIYFSYAQFPSSEVSIVVETKADPLDLADAVKNEIRSVDKSAVIFNTETLRDVMGQVLHGERMDALKYGSLGILATLLTAVGLYGILSYVARRRTHEIGIRMALGAKKGDIAGLVILNGFKITATGIAFGCLISFPLMGVFTSAIYGVAPTDVWMFSAGALAVLAISLLAGCIPAHRAAKIDPMQALKYE